MGNDGGTFFPVTSTVGKDFFNVGEKPGVVGKDEVGTMSGDYPNMKMFGYRLGVRANASTAQSTSISPPKSFIF